MISDLPRTRGTADRAEPDEWLIDAARRGGHAIPNRPRTPGTTAWRVLLNAGLVEDEVMRIASTISGAAPADFSRVSPALSALLSQGIAQKHRVVPLGVHGGALAVATSNPMNPELERELAFAAKQRVRLHPGSPAEIIRAQSIVYGAAYGSRADSATIYPERRAAPSAVQPQARPSRLSLSMPAVPAPGADPSAAPVAAPAATKAPAPTLTDRLLSAAVIDRASEAVIEPTPDGGLLVRLRVDGALYDRFRVAEAYAADMIRTLKQRTGLDASEMKRGQEGMTSFDTPSGKVGVCVRTEITADTSGEGRERIVVRLHSANGLLTIADLGFSASEQHRMWELLRSTSGLIVVAGPAHTGKTATLYAIARELRYQGRQVATIEERVEQSLDGVTQVQLRDSAPPTTAPSLMGSVARLGVASTVVVTDAPLDALMLDHCASAAGRARLFVAALDTADLAATFAHLRALHPDGAPLAAALQGVVVQRLVRRLCACAVRQAESELPAQQQRLLYGLPTASVRRPVGCAACRTTGYSGRLAIAEVVPLTRAIRDAIARRAAPSELAHLARETGIPSLWDSGMQHVLSGVLQRLVRPAVLPSRVPPPARVSRPAQVVAAASGARRTPSRVQRVLVVDDDAAARRARVRELAQAGFTVSEAADGTSALEIIKRLKPDAVVTEVALPGLDAIGLLAMDAWLAESGARAVLRRSVSAAELVKRLRALRSPTVI